MLLVCITIAVQAQNWSTHKNIELAFIFGSYAKGETHAQSDVDLFVLGNIQSMQLSDIISQVEEEIGYIEINGLSAVHLLAESYTSTQSSQMIISLATIPPIFIQFGIMA